MTDLSAFHPIKTVYSYLPFAVRRLIDELTEPYPHDVFLSSVDGGLDMLQEPTINSLIDHWDTAVRGLEQFPYRYFTAGSEEGIREFLSMLALKGVNHINVLLGDYEGYEAVAHTRGIDAHHWPMGHLVNAAPHSWSFISQPSARDGNVLPDGTLTDICEAGQNVFLDLSYLGTTDEMRLHADHPNIKAVALSFSKPFGLFYYRIGFLFSRIPIPALDANRWFKNVLSILLADRVINRLGPLWPGRTYKRRQQQLVARIADETGIPMHPSDAFLLAYTSSAEGAGLDSERRALIKPFQRADGYRYCLTPYFLEQDRTAGMDW